MAAKFSGGSIVPLARETLQERVRQQIARLILDGGIAPGEIVTVQSLADAFGVSPMPVREALRMLIEADALTVVSGRSIGIPLLSLERLSDLRNVRMEVEAIAAGWAAERASEPEIGLVARHLADLERVVAAGDAKAYVGANYAFHFAIYRCARSENLLRIVENLWLQISPYFNALHGLYTTSNQHHREMFAALQDRDVAAVKAAIRADIESAYQMLVAQLPANTQKANAS